MKKNRFMIFAAVSFLFLAGMACNFPGIAAPTPFVFPTPDLTMTAMFNPTQTIDLVETISPPTGEAAITTPEGGETIPPTELPAITDLPPALTATPNQPSPTATATLAPTVTRSMAGPGMRQENSVAGIYFATPLTIDGSFQDWGIDTYPIDNVVFGAGNWEGRADLSGSMRVAWDEDYLYLAVRVRDDRYVQNATGRDLFKGDSLEILFDREISSDYYDSSLSADDYQLGISPGSPTPGVNPQAYLWFPRHIEGPRSNVIIGAASEEEGYRVEVAIPWSVFEVTPSPGQHFGFAVSISDNDNPNENVQQSMVSNVPGRRLTDPTTWGDLTLVNP